MKRLPDELIWNMALRFDHGLGCPGYYDWLLIPGGHENRVQIVVKAMRDILEYVLSKFYGTPIPHTPFRGLLEGMIAVCPIELHPTFTTMSQLYEEIVFYYKPPSVTPCNSMPGETDQGEDSLKHAQQTEAGLSMGTSATSPMPRRYTRRYTGATELPMPVHCEDEPTPPPAMTIISTAHTRPVTPNDEVKRDWMDHTPLVSNGRTIGVNWEGVIDKACLWSAEREFDEVCKLVPPEIAAMLRDVRRPPLARLALNMVTEWLQQGGGYEPTLDDLHLLQDALVQKLGGQA